AFVRPRLRQARPRAAGDRCRRRAERPARNPGRLMRETRNPLYRPHAALAARPACLGRSMGTALVHGGGTFDRLCAVSVAQRQAHGIPATTRRSMPPPLRKIGRVSPRAGTLLTSGRLQILRERRRLVTPKARASETPGFA